MAYFRERLTQYIIGIEVTARRLSTPIMVYHGTSARMLRSILKHGLDPQYIKEGNWQEEELLYQPSRKSFGGIYFTRSPYTAVTYATAAQRKLGGLPLIVCAQLSENSVLPDEDDYSWAKSVLVSPNMISITESPHYLAQYYVKLMLSPNPLEEPAFEYYYSRALEGMRYTFDKHQQIPRLKQLVLNVLLTEMCRLLSAFRRYDKHETKDVDKEIVQAINYQEGTRYWTDDLPEKYHYLIDSLKDQAQTEVARRQALDTLIKATKLTIKTNKDDTWRASNATMRILTPVKFSGANRIIAIFTLKEAYIGPDGLYRPKEYPDPHYYITLYYGQQVPETFLKTYIARTGDIQDRIVIKRGTLAS